MAAINQNVTSKEKIMSACRAIVSQEGISAINMRSVAGKCGIALGSLYNYFPNKNELMIATIESVWQDIFHMESTCKNNMPFADYVEWIFNSILKSSKEYPHFLTAHSMSVAGTEKSIARDTMEDNLKHIKSKMLEMLNRDSVVQQNVFSAGLSKSEFLDFILDNIVLSILQNKRDCHVLIELIVRTIY